MDTPENYYVVLGVPVNADIDTVKRAYRQLARRFHPDLAGPDGAVEMKRINRAYAVLSDTEKRGYYDTVLSGVVDARRPILRPHSQPHVPDNPADVEFSGLNTFSTRGPFHAGPVFKTTHGIPGAIYTKRTADGIRLAVGSFDGNGTIWHLANGKIEETANFASDPASTIEAIRELRFSQAGTLLAGWNRLALHVWDALTGARLWSYPLTERAVSAHYSLDMSLHVTPEGKRTAYMALPHFSEDIRAPRSWGVKSTDVSSHEMGTADNVLADTSICPEEGNDKRSFWAIRMRALSQDARRLVTLSCAQIPDEQQQMVIIRRWNVAARGRPGHKAAQIEASILMGRCEDCAPPYVATPDASLLAFVYQGKNIRLCDTLNGTYSEFASGTMGGSSRLSISPDGQWLAVAREDSEINEGVIDLWSVATGQIVQKFYHPWQISALNFTEEHLIVALTDGTIQIWQ
jgi:WD40 repeat protein